MNKLLLLIPILLLASGCNPSITEINKERIEQNKLCNEAGMTSRESNWNGLIYCIPK